MKQTSIKYTVVSYDYKLRSCDFRCIRGKFKESRVLFFKCSIFIAFDVLMVQFLLLLMYWSVLCMNYAHFASYLVERGLLELRKLSIEQQLWEASRKGIDQLQGSADANHKHATDSDASS